MTQCILNCSSSNPHKKGFDDLVIIFPYFVLGHIVHSNRSAPQKKLNKKIFPKLSQNEKIRSPQNINLTVGLKIMQPFTEIIISNTFNMTQNCNCTP